MRLTRQPARARRGTVVVVAAVSMVTLLSFVALSLDGGLLLDKRRQAQSASDAAALAGAGDLYERWFSLAPSLRGSDPNGTARAAALAAAEAHGYKNGVSGCTVTVNIPPLSGPFVGQFGHVEVIVQQTQQRFFSNVFGASAVPYGSRSVSRGKRSSINDAILCLDPDNKGALNAGGGGTVSIIGAPVQVNSNHAEAMIANGGGTMIADKFLVGGSPGWSTPGGGSFTGPITPNSEPIPDPLAYLPVPDPSTMTVQSDKKLSQSGNKTSNLKPGVYVGGIQATGGTLNLDPGVYYMQGGGFSISGQANVYGSGVMIYNAPTSNSDVVSLAGGGNIVLSPMMSGPYQGVLLFQDRNSTNTVSVSGSSSGTFTITGAFYTANGMLSVTGNGVQQTLGSQYISSTLQLGGNGSFNCTWTPDLTPGKRELFLVE